ncbi:MAG: HAMP domain-containing sensor histidine kinase [Clostridia bacterium]|nr:HAMP domain-containing sensor histidine kinase [Clostridia bacterium]
MKRPAHSTLLKCTAFVLCVCLALAAFGCALGVLYLYEDGYYSGERTRYAESAFFGRTAREYAVAAYYQHIYLPAVMDERQAALSSARYERMLDPANTNYRYAVYDANTGKQLAGTIELDYQEALSSSVAADYYLLDSQAEYCVLGFLDESYAVNDVFRTQAQLFSRLLSMRYWLIVLGAVALLIAAALFIFLLCAAGRHPDAEAPECRHLDRIPFDLYGLLAAGIVAGCWAIAEAYFDGAAFLMLALVFLALTVSLVVLLAVCMSFAARVKCRCLFRNTVIGWCLRQLWRFVKWCCRGVRALFINMPLLWKTLLCVGAFLLIDVILIAMSRSSGPALLFCLLLNLAALAFCLAAALQMRRLQEGAKALADGDFSRRLDTGGLYSEFRKHAESLNGIGLGMGRAVEARMKSERMKTDLITNVSHDLKTPLTSIINYVDLLRKEALAPPAGEYVEVLERQAQRLKKLAEDVVEASKASSGTLNAHLQPTDVVELVNQGMAEYAARFAAGGLQPVLSLPEEPLVAMADGRLLWRALDNLLANAAKYAMPGTRVYITASAGEARACVCIKNISREPLNIDPAELTERFVRGDASRAAEGSGLGLSIAQSLVQLQQGTLSLSIDGDLFRADITLPLA